MLWGAVLSALAAASVAEEIGAPGPASSALADDPAAQYERGVAYAKGDGVATDYVQAAHWFAEAARHGAPEARRQLAFMAQMGLAPAGAPVDAEADVAYRVQVASVASEADGPREWRRLQRLHPEALANLSMAVEQFDGPTGDRLFRVEGGPLDEDAARAVCGKLRAAGAGCRIVRPAP